MASTFETVADIISEICDIPRENISPESHVIDDLGIDSLDFLDVAFAIDQAFGIEDAAGEVGPGDQRRQGHDRAVLRAGEAVRRIDELIAAKG